MDSEGAVKFIVHFFCLREQRCLYGHKKAASHVRGGCFVLLLYAGFCHSCEWMIISLGQQLPDCLNAEGYVGQRNHCRFHAPNSSLLHHEFTDYAYTCIAQSTVLRGVSLPTKGARLCGTCPTPILWIISGRRPLAAWRFSGVRTFLPQPQPKPDWGDHQRAGHLLCRKWLYLTIKGFGFWPRKCTVPKQNLCRFSSVPSLT